VANHLVSIEKALFPRGSLKKPWRGKTPEEGDSQGAGGSDVPSLRDVLFGKKKKKTGGRFENAVQKINKTPTATQTAKNSNPKKPPKRTHPLNPTEKKENTEKKKILAPKALPKKNLS